MEAHHVNPLTGLDEFALADAALAAASADPTGALARANQMRSPAQSRRSEAGFDAKDPATWGKVSRNNPCPCGSGKKYKHCHGKHE